MDEYKAPLVALSVIGLIVLGLTTRSVVAQDPAHCCVTWPLPVVSR